MDLKECKKYVLDFLESSNKTELKDQLEWFKTYNFSKMAKEEQVDEDNTTLAKAVYFILWYGKLPLLTTWENMEKYYGGETINTFNTLFQSEFLGIKEYVPMIKENAEFYLDVINFRIKYLTIGNFMLLPKLYVDDSSLNMAKGSCFGKYKDYADLFFMELFKENSEMQYLTDENSFYFKKIDAEKFCEENYLDDYFEKDEFGKYKPKKVFDHDFEDNKYYPYFWWQFTNKSKYGKEYKEFAQKYITEASRIIEYRANIICEKLEEELRKP